MKVETLAWFVAPALLWVALVHVVLASGVRRGELVWTGRYPRLLPPELRRRSILFAVALVAAALALAELAGVAGYSVIPPRWRMSAGFVVAVFLGMVGLFSMVKGSRWERWLFAPITLAGASLAGWITFG